MQNYEVVPIAEEHIEGFRAAVGSVAREAKYLSFLDAPSMEMARAFVLENIRENWPHYVAICEDKVIGWCDISSLHRPVLAHSGVLGIGVLAEYRGRGVGQALILASLNKAKTIGLTRVELTVREKNEAAISLYKKFGFEVEGLHRNAVRNGNIYENQIGMALLFEEIEGR